MTEPQSEQLSGETVRRLRVERGWSQGELASIAGLSSHSIVSNVERGLVPGPAVERRLREALGLLRDDVPRERVKATVSADA